MVSYFYASLIKHNMLPKISLTETQAWKNLQKHYEEEMKSLHMRTLFQEDQDRFRQFSFGFEDMLIDFSKNVINSKTVSLLLKLAEECRLSDAIHAMYSGNVINETEKRQVLHIALRNYSGQPVHVDNADVMPEVFRVLEQMKDF